MLGKTAAQLVAEAKGRVETLSPAQVAEELRRGEAVLVDLREPEERTNVGVIPGAVHAPRGMLEFYADPTGADYRSEFDPTGRIILACDAGRRSALAADTLQQMGYGNVAHLDGGLRAWQAQGLPIEPS